MKPTDPFKKDLQQTPILLIEDFYYTMDNPFQNRHHTKWFFHNIRNIKI